MTAILDGGLTAPPALWAFVLASFLIELTPGPNMAWLAMVAISEGRARGYAAVLGVALGLAVLGLAAAIGVAEVIQSSPALYQVLRWAGVVFLLYLAYDGWKGGPGEAANGQSVGFFRAFLRGVTTNLLNPKAALFYIVVLPTFVSPTLPARSQTIALTLSYVIVATIVHAAIVSLCGSLQRVINDSGREQAVRRCLSVGLALVACWFAWSTAQ